jgi:signal transduction histidine kinase
MSARLDGLVEALARDQKALRDRVHDVVSDAGDDPAASVLLEHGLIRVAHLIEEKWALDVGFTVDPRHATAAVHFERELMNILLEAAANAKKHSCASQFAIKVVVQSTDILVVVSNDRRGAARASDAVPILFDPRVLRNRVERLGGSLRTHADRDLVMFEAVIPRGTYARG